MMQYMSLGRAKRRLAEMEKQLADIDNEGNLDGITRQHAMYLEQNIDAYTKVIHDFNEQCKAQRAQGKV